MDPLTLAQLFEVFSWGDWMPDIEPWLVSCHAGILLRGPDELDNLLGLPEEDDSSLRHLFDENLRRNVLCQERCNSQATCSHMSTIFLELERSRAELAIYRLTAEMIDR